MPYHLPEEGIGYLTFDEYDRLLRAWTTAMKLLPWWWVAGEIRGGDSDAMKTRSGDPKIPLPATYLAADAITSLMNELNRWPELEDVAHDTYGSDQAKLLTREVETAAAKWPISDRTHKVKYFRCEVCQQLTLKYFPPNPAKRAGAPTVDVKVRIGDQLRDLELLDVVVRCTDRSCNAVMSHERFGIATQLIMWEQANAKRRVDSDKRSAETSEQVGSDDLPVDSGRESADLQAG